MERRYPGKVTDALRERLEYEIGVVKKMGYTNYYLIVYDFINYAKAAISRSAPAAAPVRAAWRPIVSVLRTLTPSATV